MVESLLIQTPKRLGLRLRVVKYFHDETAVESFHQ